MDVPQASAEPNDRSVELTRTGLHRFEATNRRGGVLTVGTGDDADFSPVDLLLVAIAGCSALDVEFITGKRAEPESFDVHIEGVKVRDDQGNHMSDLRVVFDVVFPEGEAGDAARGVLQSAIERSRDRLCTVSRTVALPSPVEMVQGPVDRG
jgi:uncharacterized OsmC-like protein